MAIAEQKNKTPRSDKFSEDYRQDVFVLWYNSGKPNSKALLGLIEDPDPLVGKKPSEYTLRSWIGGEFVSKAMFLDEQVATELAEKLVADKISMLYQHAQIGRRLQEWGLDYFDENELKNERTALQAIIEGLKIERQSRGTPVALAKIAGLSDEQLLDELRDVVETDKFIDAIEGEITDVDDLSDM